MKLIIELTQEEVNAHTLSLIEQLFKSSTDNPLNCKTDTGVKTVTDSNTKTTRSTTANIELYDLDEILPQPSSPTKQKQDNAERLQAFAKKIESTLNDKERKSLEKFVNFYLSKINDWKPDISIQNLWDRWISTEKK